MPHAIEKEVLDFHSDLEYQDGGIVSRILLKRPTGSVTAFAFDESQELSEHTCPYDALLHVIEGEAEVAIAGRWRQVGAGQMIVLPANVSHAVKAPQPFKMLLTMLRTVEADG